MPKNEYDNYFFNVMLWILKQHVFLEVFSQSNNLHTPKRPKQLFDKSRKLPWKQYSEQQQR